MTSPIDAQKLLDEMDLLVKTILQKDSLQKLISPESASDIPESHQTLRAQNFELRKQINELKSWKTMNIEKIVSYDKLGDLIRTQETELNDLKQKIRGKEKSNRDLRKHMRRRSKDFHVLEAELDEVGSLTNGDELLSLTSKELDFNVKKIAQEKNRIQKQLIAERQNHQLELRKLENTRKDTEIATLKEKKKMEKKIKNLEYDLKTYRNEEREVTTHVGEHEKKIRQLEDKLKDYQQKFRVKNNKISELHEKIKSLQKALQTNINQLHKKENTLEKKSKKREKIRDKKTENTLRTQETLLTNLKKQLQGNDRVIQNQERKINKLERLLNELRREPSTRRSLSRTSSEGRRSENISEGSRSRLCSPTASETGMETDEDEKLMGLHLKPKSARKRKYRRQRKNQHRSKAEEASDLLDELQEKNIDLINRLEMQRAKVNRTNWSIEIGHSKLRKTTM